MPHDDRMDHEGELIDYVVLEQGADQRRAAGDADVLSRLLLQSGDFFYEVSIDQTYFIPFAPVDFLKGC